MASVQLDSTIWISNLFCCVLHQCFHSLVGLSKVQYPWRGLGAFVTVHCYSYPSLIYCDNCPQKHSWDVMLNYARSHEARYYYDDMGWKTFCLNDWDNKRVKVIKKECQDFQRHSQKHRDNEQQRSNRSNFLMVCF